MPTIDIRFQCRHIKTDGNRCGSPALRTQEFCYFHHTTRKPATNRHLAHYELTAPDGRAAIQHAIGEVLRRIATSSIDSKSAGLLLYGLQIASSNLSRDRDPQPLQPVEDFIDDPTYGLIAPPTEFKEAQREKTVEELLDEEWAIQKVLLGED